TAPCGRAVTGRSDTGGSIGGRGNGRNTRPSGPRPCRSPRARRRRFYRAAPPGTRPSSQRSRGRPASPPNTGSLPSPIIPVEIAGRLHVAAHLFAMVVPLVRRQVGPVVASDVAWGGQPRIRAVTVVTSGGGDLAVGGREDGAGLLDLDRIGEGFQRLA